MKQERGFALLLVFVMAAAIGITLYNELPRVAFEAQRNKEQLLIDRGEQYMRAIQLYVRKVKSYPSSIEQLESTNQIRFLRKRYVDPMTGKSEWRAVHINGGGVFIDSLVHKNTTKTEEKSVNTFTYEAAATGSTVAAPTDPGAPLGRPSERGGALPPMPGQNSSGVNPLQSTPQNTQPFPVIPPGVVVPPGAGVNPFQPAQPGQPIQPGQQFPGQSPVLPMPMTGGAPTPALGPDGLPQNPAGAPGQNQALALINGILTNPNPRPVAQGSAQPMTQQIGGGIAGFASTLERTGIKVYNEMQKYNEWEFLYDPTKDSNVTGGMQQQQRPGQQQPGQQQQSNPLQQQSNPFQQQPRP